MKEIIDKLKAENNLTDREYTALLECKDADILAYLYSRGAKTAGENYGNKIYIRGLIEISSYCKNNCLYCGIRAGNSNAQRYRLTKEDIMECCKQGYDLGFRTFVLQGGEDGYYTDAVMQDIIGGIHSTYPDCAITLSLGERGEDSYRKMYEAGADRYLLRHETADEDHYRQLHPKEMSLTHRKNCLYTLRDIGYQVGCGIMVGSPYQRTEHIVKDIRFMQELCPHMIGIGPFIHHKDTPFRDMPDGSVELTLKLLAILRLTFPKVLLPATTALGTKDPYGRERGILAGANVVMPNLSPVNQRRKYSLYENKICTDSEAAENLSDLRARLAKIGYEVAVDRGDSLI